MMFGATTAAAIRLSARPARAAAASTTATAATRSLSHLFDSQCNLSNNNGTSSRSVSSRSTVASLGATSPSPLILSITTVSRSIIPHSNARQWQTNRTLFRSFASKTDKDGDKPDAAAANDDNSSDGSNEGEPTSISGSIQHDAWVQFQRSIAVSGFETGQTVREKRLGKKKRGGKLDRKRKEREAELEAQFRGEDVTQLKGGEFPALRYSDEETERLLAEAYAAIPPRAGKRGTLNLKRQKRRWLIKRMYDKRKKLERIATHERRMAKRHRISEEVKKCKREAEDVRNKDAEYRDMVLRRWAEMNGYSREVAVSNEVNA